MSDRYPAYPPGTLSVTEVIQASGLMPECDYIDEWYMNRGTAVHLATALYDKGTLDERTVDPVIRGSLESWKKYRDGYTPSSIERTLYDPVYGLCGTVDRLALLDIKGPVKSKWQVIQIAAYWHLCRVNGLGHECRAPKIVHLDPDGGLPKVDTFTTLQMMEASKEFLTLLAALRIKEKYT